MRGLAPFRLVLLARLLLLVDALTENGAEQPTEPSQDVQEVSADADGVALLQIVIGNSGAHGGRASTAFINASSAPGIARTHVGIDALVGSRSVRSADAASSVVATMPTNLTKAKSPRKVRNQTHDDELWWIALPALALVFGCVCLCSSFAGNRVPMDAATPREGYADSVASEPTTPTTPHTSQPDIVPPLTHRGNRLSYCPAATEATQDVQNTAPRDAEPTSPSQRPRNQRVRIIEPAFKAGWIWTQYSVASIVFGQGTRAEATLFHWGAKSWEAAVVLWSSWWVGATIGLLALANILSPAWEVMSILMLPLPAIAAFVLSLDLVKEIVNEFDFYLLIFFNGLIFLLAMSAVQGDKWIFWVCYLPTMGISLLVDAYPNKWRATFSKMFFMGHALVLVTWNLIMIYGKTQPFNIFKWDIGYMADSNVCWTFSTTLTLLIFCAQHMRVAFFHPDTFVILKSALTTHHEDLVLRKNTSGRGPKYTYERAPADKSSLGRGDAGQQPALSHVARSLASPRNVQETPREVDNPPPKRRNRMSTLATQLEVCHEAPEMESLPSRSSPSCVEPVAAGASDAQSPTSAVAARAAASVEALRADSDAETTKSPKGKGGRRGPSLILGEGYSL